MLIDRHLLDEKLSHFEERALDVSASPAVFYAMSIALRYGDARDIESTIAMARLLRESARSMDLNA